MPFGADTPLRAVPEKGRPALQSYMSAVSPAGIEQTHQRVLPRHVAHPEP